MADPPMAVPATLDGKRDSPDENRVLGARLRELRQIRGLSLKDVTAEVDLSESFLSLVERGHTDLSVSRFSRLSEFYGVPPSDLLIEIGSKIREPTVGCLDDLRSVHRGTGVEYHILQEQNPQMIHVRLASKASFDDFRAHRGEDYWLVVQGQPRLHYGGVAYDLKSGMTARFASTIPHGLSNPRRVPAVLVALCTIPYW